FRQRTSELNKRAIIKNMILFFSHKWNGYYVTSIGDDVKELQFNFMLNCLKNEERIEEREILDLFHLFTTISQMGYSLTEIPDVIKSVMLIIKNEENYEESEFFEDLKKCLAFPN
ncbi:hypothetical protein SNEBB_008081, partial [Seison nebaliae]